MRRVFESARDDEAHVHVVTCLHVVRVDCTMDEFEEFALCQLQVHEQSFGRFEQAVDVILVATAC